MSEIRCIHIRNFRSIKELLWYPRPGLNCLIGPGDSGKSTILDAIDLALGARRFYPFTDADFYGLNTTNPIEISITLGKLEVQLKNIEKYGSFLRGFNGTTKLIVDEPQYGLEDVITLRLIVGEDLEPDWHIFSERAHAEGLERKLSWKHRELVTPARLDVASHRHLAWGNRSVLNKLSEESLDVSATLAAIGRRTRQIFAEQPLEDVNGILERVKQIANNLGVEVGDLQALLDVNGVSLSNGAISIHDNENIPLRQLGTGSSRLLISGLLKAASTSSILIVDEAEYGLEPFRITRFLNELGSKDAQPSKQVFITTHSPNVLRELQAQQLHVVRKRVEGPPFPPPFCEHSHKVYALEGGEAQQATLRACAEAFFSRAVIVGEGKTEVGLVKGMDLCFRETGQVGIIEKGVFCTDGGGDDHCLRRAKIFNSLCYPTAILKDSDKITQPHLAEVESCRTFGITIFEWEYGMSIEKAIFSLCRQDMIPLIIDFALRLYGEQNIDQHIRNFSENRFGAIACQQSPNDDMRQCLAKAADKYKWFKDISKAEELFRFVIGPNLIKFSPHFSGIINNVFAWAREVVI